MLDVERRHETVDFVQQRNGATVAELSAHFGVSSATVRRDLLQLSNQELIEKAHGGAAPKRSAQAAQFLEPPVLERASMQMDEKHAIGLAAARLVEDGDTIMVGTGTTTEAMVPHLGNHKGLTVITNALNVALRLAQYEQIMIVLPGGVLRHSEFSMLGMITEDALANLRADKLFIGSAAVHTEYGLSSNHTTEVQSDRAIMEAVREITVLADRTKFDRVAAMRVAPIARVDRIVTDDKIPSATLTVLRERGVKVEVAEVASVPAKSRGRSA